MLSIINLLCFKTVTFSTLALYGFPTRSKPVTEIDTVPAVKEVGGDHPYFQVDWPFELFVLI